MTKIETSTKNNRLQSYRLGLSAFWVRYLSSTPRYRIRLPSIQYSRYAGYQSGYVALDYIRIDWYLVKVLRYEVIKGLWLLYWFDRVRYLINALGSSSSNNEIKRFHVTKFERKFRKLLICWMCNALIAPGIADVLY